MKRFYRNPTKHTKIKNKHKKNIDQSSEIKIKSNQEKRILESNDQSKFII